MNEYAHRDVDDYKRNVDSLSAQFVWLKSKYSGAVVRDNHHRQTIDENLQDPTQIGTKGCGTTSRNASGRRRQSHTCGNCGASGNNRRCCPMLRQSGLHSTSNVRIAEPVEDNNDGHLENEVMHQLVSDLLLP